MYEYDVKKQQKSHLEAIKGRLLKIKASLDDIDYWTKENELEIAKLCEKDIKHNYLIILRRLEHFESDLNLE